MGRATKESKKAAHVSTTDKARPGSICTVKHIYRDPKDDSNWLSEYPEDAGEAAENEETAKVAVIVRNAKSEDSRRKFEAHSIIIQSEWLQSILHQNVFKNYPGVTCEMRRLIFSSPFEPFVHRWLELQKLQRRDDLDEITRGHVDLLHDTLARELGDTRIAYEDCIANGVITWEYLWILFEPGTVVVAQLGGALVALETHSTEYGEHKGTPIFMITCEGIDWSGTDFGRERRVLPVPKFSGTRKIDALLVYPLRYHKAPTETKAYLTKRGTKFEELAGYHYMEYSGVAISWDDRGEEVSVYVSGRIIVDIEFFNVHSPYSGRCVGNLNDSDLGSLDQKSDGRVKLTPHHQMLCHPRVRGYFPKMKLWLDFFVDLVVPVCWKPEAFGQLVLRSDQKDLILAVIESQRDNRLAFEDFVAGKGQGILALLSGPPGTGKTITAEAVAEHLRVPLHTVSSGDLGSGAWEIERRLKKTMSLVARWNAILLVDECDIFLEARTTHDLQRNAVVSVFLRCLEYYEGILFMTTNRPENMDVAFRSRIHLMLQYPKLESQSRRQIWSNLLQSSAPNHELTEDDLTQLGTHELNGREIKNAVKIAQLLALKRKTGLNRLAIDTALGIERKWQNPDINTSQPGCSGFSSPTAKEGLMAPPNGDTSRMATDQETAPLKRARDIDVADGKGKKKTKKRKKSKAEQ
ncbi:P-loop containing nucleoside triphosphate hydrolase protein [Aspergillus taichungensis]|uniref:P-loop containing nucleoside triphosphate hydrolase protein n=1 Tax=Aspergillus taichungensis TaxID=482145 RepID=A0A2J5I3M7_9EURO|nr:P-loop containing nucleoside triphosphate hydrolase protein [Aspergillus taichungensis]